MTKTVQAQPTSAASEVPDAARCMNLLGYDQELRLYNRCPNLATRKRYHYYRLCERCAKGPLVLSSMTLHQ